MPILIDLLGGGFKKRKLIDTISDRIRECLNRFALQIRALNPSVIIFIHQTILCKQINEEVSQSVMIPYPENNLRNLKNCAVLQFQT